MEPSAGAESESRQIPEEENKEDKKEDAEDKEPEDKNATEEGAASTPLIATEEAGRVSPTVAIEKGTSSGMEATEEGEGSAAMITKEEATKDTLTLPTEEMTGSASMVSMRERAKDALITASDEKFSGQTDVSSMSLLDVSGEKSMESTLSSEVTISLPSSGLSSVKSEFPVHMDLPAVSDSEVTQSAVFPSHLDSAARQMTSEVSRHSPTHPDGEVMARYAEQELAIREAGREIQLVVLDPNHPLMKRFQSALKTYLNKQKGKVADEIQELAVGIKSGKKQREEVGVLLYSFQQQLARLQMELEKNHSCHSQIAMIRRQLEEELHDLRDTYKKKFQSTQDERKRVSSVQMEIENLSLRLFYMQNMDQDVRDDIAVMKRTVKKAEVERMRAEVEKQKQDLHVDRLTRRVDELEEQIALYDAQYMAQAEDTRITRQEVGEASIEIQAINLEKKQLLHQWTVSLTGMKRRDEAYAAMQEALRDSRHKLKSLEAEIEVYKKSIIKEEERNELLASILNRSENDANTSRKLIAQNLSKQDAMKVEFGTYTRILQETEQALNRATADRAACMNDLAVLRREIEKGSQTKQEKENEIMAKLQDQMISNKAAKYFLQIRAKLQNTMLILDTQLIKLENETAQTSLDITNTNNKLNMLQKNLSELNKELDELNSEISHSETEIAKRNLLIGRKQGTINLYNKKLEMMISQLGGQELGPLEIEIKKLTKQIDEMELEVMKLQRHWMKQQRELVKLTQEREEQLVSLDMLKKEITIKEQKKLRVENDIQQEKNELKDIERHMKNMSNDLVKLHLLINKNSENSNELEQGNTIMENEFVRSLKISERESIEMQEKLDRLHEEKERLLNSLVEAECQMMQWEKKIQIAKEMRAAVDSEAEQSEIRAMKSEIHRMQVRYQQLRNQQEKLMRNMEAAVSRRETIVVRAEGQSKMNKQVLTKGDFHYKKLELKKKIKETQKCAEECNKTIIQLEQSQQNLHLAITEKERQLSNRNYEAEELDENIEQLQARKRQNLSDIVSNQTRVKNMQAVKEGKYSLLCRSEIMARVEHHKVEERLRTLNTVLYQIDHEYPHYHKTLHRINQVITQKLEELSAQDQAEEK
ncbi:coiled-coil domain-containing protein 40 isoform X1 [Crotalus tigris]|uniref:coiled-coil domain-containing protein 40 isoform X1 n=2 Tax=Crotalus tigris TaxID=88082 RepID=UPI00192F346D|nr:coiled-coil domain-containing protein 40 isoform X1 [Crotalus tigris]